MKQLLLISVLLCGCGYKADLYYSKPIPDPQSQTETKQKDLPDESQKKPSK
ncbi:MAG: hypothetical protein QM538_05615 [Methylacidiphilales bacterium]|nr:hypothetical protein [Candidatus Methylacidiphilales bacterium]